MNISVCIATYNGSSYILEQIYSILEQLNDDDEIIIVDDSSSDNTLQLLIGINDCRIKIYQNNRNFREIYTFSRAISLAKNDIIFLSDQDDVWIKDRVKLMKAKLLDSNSLLISTNHDLLFLVDRAKFKMYPLKAIDSNKYFMNVLGIFLGKRDYFGCAMAFKKDLRDIILPIPTYIESHDIWIALIGNIMRSNIHLEIETLTRKIHSNNATKQNRKFYIKLWARIIHLSSVFHIFYRILYYRLKHKSILI